MHQAWCVTTSYRAFSLNHSLGAHICHRLVNSHWRIRLLSPHKPRVEALKSLPSLHTGISHSMSRRTDHESHLPPSFNVFRGSQLGFGHNDTTPVIHPEAARWDGTIHAEKQEYWNNGLSRETARNAQECFRKQRLIAGNRNVTRPGSKLPNNNPVGLDFSGHSRR